MAGNLIEQAFNFELARAFRKIRRRWSDDNVKPERKKGKKQIDIWIGLHGSEVAVETEWDTKTNPGNEDAKARLDQCKDLRAAIAVSIPRDLRNLNEDNIQKSLVEDSVTLGYAAFQRTGKQILRTPEDGYLYGNTNDLADFINMASISQAQTEECAQKLSSEIKEGAKKLSDALSDTEKQELIESINHKWKMDDLQVVMLLWYNALSVHKHLYEHNRKKGDEIPPLPEPPRVLNDIINPKELIFAWSAILKTNWHSVFETAHESLLYAYNLEAKLTAHIITKLYRLMTDSRMLGVGEHVNMGGEIYQRILAGRRETAAFYTAAPIAELLAHLTIREEDRKDWGAEDLFENLRIADLACGTGTLLRAGYLRVRQLHERKKQDSDLGSFHKLAMEKGIIGADINRISSHLSNTSLTDVGEGEAYDETQIAHVDVGEKGVTGSLEFLEGNYLDDLQLQAFSERTSGSP
ncbi:MAG: hypothetical protein OXB93_06505, partial [Cytophagales bacterium]|nr:hypothetical protein [Cytophagales bacterium]